MALRQFLYCDDDLVNDFLEQLEGGRTDEVTRREHSQREGHGDLKVGFSRLGAGAGAARSTSEEIEGVTKQTRASRFDRMYDLAIDAGELDEPDELDENSWASMRPRRLIAVDVHVSIPDVSRLLAMGDGLGGLVDLVRMFAPEQIDDEAQEMLGKIGALTDASSGVGTLSAVAIPAGTDLNLVMRLQTRCLLSKDDLEGEATLVAKVTRKLKTGERELVLDVPGLGVMNRDMRREMLRGDSAASVSVGGPGGVVVPIAIFR